jgi:hypothetical protein
LFQRGRGFGDELESFAAKAQVAQSGVEEIQLLAGFFDLFAQAMDKR